MLFRSEAMPYAFDEKLGYLTSSPINAGTGLRASVMLCLPALGTSGKIEQLIDEVSRYGVTLRSIYGEGNKNVAYIYQICNNKTLGISENDIIDNMNTIVDQVIKQERRRREFILESNFDKYEDQVYRS